MCVGACGGWRQQILWDPLGATRLNSGPLEEHSAFHHLSSPSLFSVLSTYISCKENRYHCDIPYMCVRDLNRTYHLILCYPSLPPPAPMFYSTFTFFFVCFCFYFLNLAGERQLVSCLSESGLSNVIGDLQCHLLSCDDVPFF